MKRFGLTQLRFSKNHGQQTNIIVVQPNYTRRLEKRSSQYTEARRWFQLWTLQVSHQKRFIRTLSCIHCEYQLSGSLPCSTRCLQPSSKGETLFCNLCASPVAAACPNVDMWARCVNKFDSNSFSTRIALDTVRKFIWQRWGDFSYKAMPFGIVNGPGTSAKGLY